MVKGQSREVTVGGWGDVYVPREVPVSAGKVRGKDDATAHSFPFFFAYPSRARPFRPSSTFHRLPPFALSPHAP